MPLLLLPTKPFGVPRPKNGRFPNTSEEKGTKTKNVFSRVVQEKKTVVSVVPIFVLTIGFLTQRRQCKHVAGNGKGANQGEQNQAQRDFAVFGGESLPKDPKHMRDIPYHTTIIYRLFMLCIRLVLGFSHLQPMVAAFQPKNLRFLMELDVAGLRGWFQGFFNLPEDETVKKYPKFPDFFNAFLFFQLFLFHDRCQCFIFCPRMFVIFVSKSFKKKNLSTLLSGPVGRVSCRMAITARKQKP